MGLSAHGCMEHAGLQRVSANEGKLPSTARRTPRAAPFAAPHGCPPHAALSMTGCAQHAEGMPAKGHFSCQGRRQPRCGWWAGQGSTPSACVHLAHDGHVLVQVVEAHGHGHDADGHEQQPCHAPHPGPVPQAWPRVCVSGRPWVLMRKTALTHACLHKAGGAQCTHEAASTLSHRVVGAPWGTYGRCMPHHAHT